MAEKQSISIWFFIGTLLTFYGVLVFAVGLYDLVVPGTVHVAMEHLHAQVWWGALLLIVGLFYAVRFRPGKG